MNKTAYIVRIVRDIAVTIAAVLLIVSMVHKKYNGFYLALPITTDSYNGSFNAKVKIDNDKLGIRVDDGIDVRHENSCVDGYNFRRIRQ